MPPRTRKPARARTRKVRRSSPHERALQQELEGLYALDTRASRTAITRPSKARWLVHVALVAPAILCVQAVLVFGVPLVTRLWNRPEFIVFRLGE